MDGLRQSAGDPGDPNGSAGPGPAQSAPGDAGGLGDPGGLPVPRTPRPLVERLGLGAIALVAATLFGAMGAAAAASGELFLAAMAGLGALMTLWVGALTLIRG